MNATARHEEIAQAQVRFREQNEAIQASSDSLAMLGPIPFICECPVSDCAEIVRALIRLSPAARVPVVVLERAGETV